MQINETKIETNIPDELRIPLLNAGLVHVPFDGWSDNILTLAAHDLGLDPGMAQLAFPEGINGMIDLLATHQDEKMIAVCPNKKLSKLKIREKITCLVRARIEAEGDIRETARRTVTTLALPSNIALGLKILYRTVDLMWKTIHDTSTDFNYYTKRMTLSAVYSATFLYWLNDESENYKDTWAFLDRRIADVMTFEKNKALMRGKVQNVRNKLPDFWREISKLRYPPSV